MPCVNDAVYVYPAAHGRLPGSNGLACGGAAESAALTTMHAEGLPESAVLPCFLPGELQTSKCCNVAFHSITQARKGLRQGRMTPHNQHTLLTRPMHYYADVHRCGQGAVEAEVVHRGALLLPLSCWSWGSSPLSCVGVVTPNLCRSGVVTSELCSFQGLLPLSRIARPRSHVDQQEPSWAVGSCCCSLLPAGGKFYTRFDDKGWST